VSQTRMEVNDPCLIPLFIDFYIHFLVFEKHTTGIDLNLMKKMGYKGGGLVANDQGILDPIKVVEWPRYIKIDYVQEEVGECSKTKEEEKYKTPEKKWVFK
jgi:hypothetical protein